MDEPLSDDFDSEMSSGLSVASTSLTGGGGLPTPTVMGACPAPFGVHLEWILKLRQRLPRTAQLSLQRGCCPGCKERMTTSLFAAPRYCHYLCCYFCPTCHDSDLRIIPARVAERWDFKAKKVCQMAAHYLDMQSRQPLVPITQIRRTKVSSQTVLTEMHNLRQTLTRLKELLLENGCDYHDTLSFIVEAQLPSHMVEGHELYTLQELVELNAQG